MAGIFQMREKKDKLGLADLLDVLTTGVGIWSTIAGHQQQKKQFDTLAEERAQNTAAESLQRQETQGYEAQQDEYNRDKDLLGLLLKQPGAVVTDAVPSSFIGALQGNEVPFGDMRVGVGRAEMGATPEGLVRVPNDSGGWDTVTDPTYQRPLTADQIADNARLAASTESGIRQAGLTDIFSGVMPPGTKTYSPMAPMASGDLYGTMLGEPPPNEFEYMGARGQLPENVPQMIGPGKQARMPTTSRSPIVPAGVAVASDEDIRAFTATNGRPPTEEEIVAMQAPSVAAWRAAQGGTGGGSPIMSDAAGARQTVMSKLPPDEAQDSANVDYLADGLMKYGAEWLDKIIAQANAQ